MKRTLLLALLLTSLSAALCQAAATTFDVVDLVGKYQGDGSFSCTTVESASEVDCEIVISNCPKATLVIKPAKKVKGLLKPYNFTINCGAAKLNRLVMDLGIYQTGIVHLTCANVGGITTRSCDLKLKCSGTKINTIVADPGISEADARLAKVGLIQVTKYIGNVDEADTSYIEPMPAPKAYFLSIEKVKTLKYNQYKEHWISQLVAEKIGTIRASSVSHLVVTDKLRALRTYNLTGHITTGCLEEPVFDMGGTNVYYRGKIDKLFCANIYGCQIRAGVPDLHESLLEYYNIVPALGVIGKLRAGAMVDTIIVTKRKMKIPGKLYKPYYGNGVEIWENCKLREIKLKK